MTALTLFSRCRFHLRMCCLVALSFFCLLRPALADVEVVFDFYHLAGNLSVAQRDALLADPGWQVSASYSPLISVPGVTASWSRCGFLSLPCLQDDHETVNLSGAEIRRDGTRLSFRLPGYVGLRRFRLANVNLRLAKNPYDSIQRPELFILMDPKTSSDQAPVAVDGGSFILAGSLTVKGTPFRVGSPGSVDGDVVWRQNELGPYVFMPQHRFALYRQPYQFSGKEVSWSAIPQAFAGMHLYRAILRSVVVDGHRIESVDIAASQERGDCYSNHLDYRILYVDGEAIQYVRTMPDPDLAQCHTYFRRMAWDDAGRVLSYDTSVTNWINHGSSVEYADWSVNCSKQASGNYS